MKKFKLLLMLMCALLGFSQASAATESWGYYITGTSSGAPVTLWKNLKSAVSLDKALDMKLQGNMTSSSTTIGNNGTIEWKGYAIPNDNATALTTAADGSFKPSNLGLNTSYAVQIGNNQGASNNYANPLVLSTSAFSGKTIKSVSVWAKSGKGATYTVAVTVGSTTATSTSGAITSSIGNTSDPTTVNVNATGANLEIKFVPKVVTSSANKSLVFCGIKIEYEDGGSVTPSEPVNPNLGVNNTLAEGKLVVMNGQEETLDWKPADIKVNAPTGNDPSIATYENGNIVAKGVGTTTFHFTSDAVEYKYTAGELDLIVEVTEYTQPLKVTFDFVSENYGLIRVNSTTSSSAANEGYVVENTTITSNNIIIKFTGTKGFRLWETSSDAYLRAYSGGGFVITAPEGYIFDRMTFTGTGNWEVGTENQGTYSNMVWTAGENKLSEVKFSYTGKSSGNWKTLDVVLKPAAAAVPAIVVSYDGNPMGENDHFTLVKDSELEVLVENAEAAKVTYYILDENVQGATAESGVVENNKFVLDKVGKFRIEFIASDAANTVLASKTVYVIVKGSDTEITSTTYTLDFVNNTYGMMLNPATGSQVGENNNFTGTNTNGLVFFIPKGTNPVSLGNANDGQELKMEQGGEFRVNINNYGQKIAKVEITGSNLDVLTITSNYDAAAEGVMTDGKLVYTPGTDVIARDFVVKYPATRAAGDPVYIKGINVTTAVDTAVEAIDAETAESVYYDLQGNRVVNPERGIYIKVVGTKATKVLL